ncbi:MAG: rod shape-determining protein MreC [Candidatus Pacebacteria bacterium]|nr:rod shape-determining protein MreC [Candidatus Paceibacterota bacterium]
MANGFRNSGSSGRNARRRLMLATFLAVVVLLLNIALGGKLSSLARDIAAPIASVGGKAGEAIGANGYFTTRGALEAQIAALQAQLQQEQLQSGAYAALEQQNQSLSSLEHLAQTTPGLAAPIISSIISSPYGTFSIGAGSADSVSVGSLALTSGNFVVGKVSQVQAHQSLVTELFASGQQTPVTIDSASVVAAGSGGQAIAQVPHGVTVAVGDPVLSPQMGNRPVGVVQHVDSNPANAQQAVYVSLPVSLSSLQYVYVSP